MIIRKYKFDKEYDSLSSAAEDTNTFLINVSRSAKLGYRVDKYQFSFIKKDYYADAKKFSEWILSTNIKNIKQFLKPC